MWLNRIWQSIFGENEGSASNTPQLTTAQESCSDKLIKECANTVRYITENRLYFNWDTYSMYNYRLVRYRLPESCVEVDIFRGIRGTLVEFYIDGIVVLAWADQTAQYKGMLGINDVMYTSIEELRLVAEVVRKFKEGLCGIG